MKSSSGSECVMFMPPLPASRNLRPTEGMASYRSTCTPCRASTSAAIRPAGPAPMMLTALPARVTAAGSVIGRRRRAARLRQQGLQIGQPVLRRDHFIFLGYGIADVEVHFLDEARRIA